MGDLRKRIKMLLNGSRQIPRIVHSRSQLSYYRHPFENGAQCIYLSSDTYPELFRLRFPAVYRQAPNGWQQKADRPNQKYIWFPPDAIDEETIAEIDAWGARFQDYILLGLNDNLKNSFSTELDFCLAVSFNRLDPESERTIMGEAEFQLKYRLEELTGDDKKKYAKRLMRGLSEGFDDLPLLSADNVLISAIPADEPGKKKLAWRLAKALARKKECEFLAATLKCSRRSLKTLSLQEKIAEWQEVFESEGCVDLSHKISGQTVVVVDDLYQSGATMWCYAAYLKARGARCILGLVCVKSLRDSDNQ